MSRTDFEQRWLTLGTDSKVGSTSGLSHPPIDKDQEIRPLLGEKGIGRLAIAIIGRQVLILTRAKTEGFAAAEITAAYIHWGLFELPGIDLDEITIPLATFNANLLPSIKEIEDMISLAKNSLKKISHKIPLNIYTSLLKDMDSFKVNPREIATYLSGPSFNNDETGTHFYIFPADNIINDDIDLRDEENKATRFEKHLIGFTNTMTPEFKKPKIITKFRDHLDEGEPIERVGEKAFFTPDEFLKVDHHIRGHFNEYGQFRGKVGVYQTLPTDYILNWSNTDGKPTTCGPFDFSIAIIQPNPKDSLVEPTDHALIRRKLERHGGIYIYKDGIRVQPYGGTENDFLDIERRRSSKASTYFYSFRNMMGAIELTSLTNSSLVEKAGREGFREDKAYRQFRSILINFFIQSAADFFVDQGKYSEEWSEKRLELQHLEDVRRNHEKKSKAKKNIFEVKLNNFFEELDAKKQINSVNQVISVFERKISSEITNKKSIENKALAIGRIEAEAKAELDKIRKNLIISKPRGVGLNKEIFNNWQIYQEEFNTLSKDVLRVAENKIENTITVTVETNKLNLKPSIRLNAAVRKHSNEAITNIKSLRDRTESTLTELSKTVRDTTRDSFRTVSKAVDEVLVNLESMKATTQTDFDFSKEREKFEMAVAAAFDKENEKLHKLAAQLEAVLSSAQANDLDMLEVTEALDEEVTALRARQDADAELSQIGMALNTINHEFSKTAGGLRDGFRRLKSWANANPDLKRLYEDMRTSFDHLDNYLSLFNPLDRRLQQNAVNIKGSEIYEFVSDLFEKRLIRHNVTLKANARFMSHTVLPSRLLSYIR